MSLSMLYQPARRRGQMFICGLPLVLLSLSFVGAEVGAQSPAYSSTTASTSQQTVSGVVLNANTNQPVARALVQLGSRSILTEHDGRFQFPNGSESADAESSEFLRVTKPGYYESLDPNSSGKQITLGSKPESLKVYLYPEALITGTLIAPNGDPLPGIYIQALRKTVDESGSAWIVAGQTSSNSDGQFRLPLSAGDYLVESHYAAEQPIRGQAVLPVIFPDPSSGGEASGHSGLHLDSGSEQRLDLRPSLQRTHDVHIQFDGTANQGFPQIEAHLPNGLSFYPVSRPSGSPGEYIATLPTGSYTLTMANGGRDGSSFARASVNVGESELTRVALHLTHSLPMPVELSVDTSSSSANTSDNQPPSVQQLNLRFVRSDQSATEQNQTVYMRSGRGEAANFSLPPGKYHLIAQPLSQWFIESATVGGTDLLTQDFDVDAGGTSAPLRITVSNHTAGLMGTVKLDGNPGSSCWVYLVANSPGVNPVIYAISDNQGRFSRPSIPPGSYRAVAFESHHSEDFSDSATLDRLAPYMKSVTVAAGEIATLDIDAIPTVELKH